MSSFLKGRILIASPNMEDTRFERAIILICDHDDEHALGIVLNRPLHDITMQELYNSLGIDLGLEMDNQIILDGGPCQPDRGFVIHSDDWQDCDSVAIIDGLSLSVSKEILRVMVEQNIPKKHIVALGYAGWGPGQLESEIAQNSWFIADAKDDIIFSPLNNEQKWQMLMRANGIDPARLSPFSGNA